MLFPKGRNLYKKSLRAVLRDAFPDLGHSVFSQKNLSTEKASRCTFEGCEGSLTAEAALAFPLVLFALTALVYLFPFFLKQTQVSRALTEQARGLAQSAYLTETWLDTELTGAGLTGIGRDGELVVQDSYVVNLPPGLSWIGPVWVTQKKTVRGWIGFQGRTGIENLEEDDLVYVTEYGTVYHRSLECRHLRLSITKTNLEEVKQLRSTDGGKYTACEYCGEKTVYWLYVTQDGDRYHSTLQCQGLVRKIRTVPFSEVGGRLPCSVCGGEA